MIKIKLNTGEIVEVTKNIAHGFIESGKAVLYKTKQVKKKRTRQMRAGESIKYKTK